MQVNTGRTTQYNGALAGAGAAAVAVVAGAVFAGVLVMVVWSHIAGQVSVAVQVVVWAAVACVVAVAGAVVVSVCAWACHRVRNPEVLVSRRAVRAEARAEVLAETLAARELPAPAPVAELPAGPLWRPGPYAVPEHADLEE